MKTGQGWKRWEGGKTCLLHNFPIHLTGAEHFINDNITWDTKGGPNMETFWELFCKGEMVQLVLLFKWPSGPAWCSFRACLQPLASACAVSSVNPIILCYVQIQVSRAHNKTSYSNNGLTHTCQHSRFPRESPVFHTHLPPSSRLSFLPWNSRNLYGQTSLYYGAPKGTWRKQINFFLKKLKKNLKVSGAHKKLSGAHEKRSCYHA